MTDIPGLTLTEGLSAAPVGSELEIEKSLVLSAGAERGDNILLSVFSSHTPAAVGEDILGALLHSYGDDQIYERIWFKPNEIAAGFISEDKPYIISIWNAYQTTIKQITGIVPTNPAGTALTADTLPTDIPPTGERLHTITVLRDGPTTQDTQYSYTIDGIVFVVDIQGQRIIPFSFEPNWIQDVSLTYLMQTIISNNRLFVEQRRPLLDEIVREQKFALLVNQIEAQRVINDYSFANEKLLAVPVYQEHMTTTTAITGATVLAIVEDFTKFYNLNNLSDFVFLLDRATGKHEVKGVASIGGGNITLDNAVGETLDKASTSIYPAMLATFREVSVAHPTDNIAEISAEFQEVI
ncbi:hypothetical protein KAR91_27655 [Candidatus Pacearchaeota archaeon]|nr:hypothetical protein [Candidatus Pacearchaeota archaeon]